MDTPAQNEYKQKPAAALATITALMEAVQRMRIRIDELEATIERQARQIEGLEHELSREDPIA